VLAALREDTEQLRSGIDEFTAEVRKNFEGWRAAQLKRLKKNQAGIRALLKSEHPG